jgi:hypothetical protein
MPKVLLLFNIMNKLHSFLHNLTFQVMKCQCLVNKWKHKTYRLMRHWNTQTLVNHTWIGNPCHTNSYK